MRELLKKITFVRFLAISFRALKNKHSLHKKIRLLAKYYLELYIFKKRNLNSKFILKYNDIYPCLFDNTKNTYVGATYFYQDTWCAKKVFESKPEHHYDIGSLAELVGIISQFTTTTMIDIRPIGLSLPGLNFIHGDILNLPFSDNQIKSLSSICVIEHIGLGRYGDKIDSFGSEKAAKELSRVLAKDGNLYISVPIDSSNKIYFNAHRAFTREYLLSLFSDLLLVEEKYIYRDKLEDKYVKEKGFGTGLFHFKKS